MPGVGPIGHGAVGPFFFSRRLLAPARRAHRALKRYAPVIRVLALKALSSDKRRIPSKMVPTRYV